MTKGGAAKTWIAEVEAKDREIERLEEIKDLYLDTIHLLACEKEELEAENKKVVNAAESGIAKAWRRVEELEDAILDLWHKSGADHKGRNYGIDKDIKATVDALLTEQEQDDVG